MESQVSRSLVQLFEIRSWHLLELIERIAVLLLPLLITSSVLVRIDNCRQISQYCCVTLELPDQETMEFTPAELRLEVACALYGRGMVGKVRGAHIAGIDFFEFQRALGERQIPSYTSEMLHRDVESLKKLLPE